MKRKDLAKKIKVNHYMKAAPEYISKKGKGSLNPPFRSKENNSVGEGKNEQQNA